MLNSILEARQRNVAFSESELSNYIDRAIIITNISIIITTIVVIVISVVIIIRSITSSALSLSSSSAPFC
jgi:hypothetical protein